MDGHNGCKCMCHKAIGILIFLFGTTFFLGYFNFLSADMVDLVWPIIIMLVGGSMMMEGKCGCCKK